MPTGPEPRSSHSHAAGHAAGCILFGQLEMQIISCAALSTPSWTSCTSCTSPLTSSTSGTSNISRRNVSAWDPGVVAPHVGYQLSHSRTTGTMIGHALIEEVIQN